MASIYKRENVWYLSYRVGGKRVRKSVGRSKKLAILAQKEVEVQLAKKKLGWEEIIIIMDSEKWDLRVFAIMETTRGLSREASDSVY